MRYFFNIPSNDNLCNLDCAYCIVKENDELKENKRVFSLDKLFKFIEDNIEPEDDILIGFGGSEPFTNNNIDDTIKTLEWIDKNDFEISLLTNGLLNVDVIKKYSHLLTNRRKTEDRKISDLIITYHRHELGNTEVYYENLIKELTDLDIAVVFQEMAIPCLIEKSKNFLYRMSEKYKITTKMITLRAWGSTSFNMDFITKLYKDYDELGNTSYTNYSNITQQYCSCFKGYDTYHILYSGKIVKCWYNQQEVGNVVTEYLDKSKAIKIEYEIDNNEIKQKQIMVDNVDKNEFIENELIDILISENL